MNAPEIKALGLGVPAFLERRQPARYGWWSDRTLVILKGDDVVTLDLDDLRELRRFFEQFEVES